MAAIDTPPNPRGASRSTIRSVDPADNTGRARPKRLAPLAGTLALLCAGCGSGGAKVAGETPAVPVRVARTTTRDVPLEIRAVGNVEAYSTVAIKSRVAGQVAEVEFDEGDRVHAGDLLFSLDSRTFEASLAEARANLAREVAEAKLAEAQASRQQRLFDEGVSSRDTLDVAATQVSALKAAIDADRAAVESAQLYLDYCSIRSPIEGVVGEVLVHAGNVVKENDTMLAVVRQHVPVYVSFAVPERHLAAIRKRQKEAALQVTATTPGDGSGAAVGELTFIDNTVDEMTGTILLKALFANEDEGLWPGQFVDASLTLAMRQGVVVAPERAVVLGQDGQFAFVVRDDRTVESRPVVSERAGGGLAVITKGLSSGETVVVDGQLRLVAGARVTILEDEAGISPTSSGESGGSGQGGVPAGSSAGGSTASADR